MNKRKIAKVLKTMATEIVSGSLDGEYEVATLKPPRQKDGDSCGVLVCLCFWGQVSSDAPDNVSRVGVTRMRWEMLRAVMEMKSKESVTL
jgi:Ulp1 family protease